MKRSRELRDMVLGLYHDFSAESGEIFSLSEEAAFIGTAVGELWIGGRAIRAVLRAQDKQIGRITVIAGDIRAFEEGSVGWAYDVFTSVLPDGQQLPVRMSFVFHREDGEWKVVHAHASQGTSNLETLGQEIDLSMEAIARFIEEDRPSLDEVTSPEGTVTIVFTDMEASTATNEALGDDKFLPLLLRHNEILTKETISSGGSVVKSQGDGYMLAFSSARRAVDCTIAVQRQVAQLEPPLKVRMGLHTGEPVRHSDDFYGRDVAYAARLGAAATGGEILVSSLVKSLVEPSGSVSFTGPRELELKGFDGPQPVYTVVWQS